MIILNNILKKLVLDYKNFNFKNEEEQVVVNSNFFSAYKGKLVLRTNKIRSGSLGILMITRKGNPTNIKELIRHEYGHTVQLQQLGFLRYLLFIGIPSWKQWKKEIPYYERPWEITADLFGGVTSRKHTEEKLATGIDYLATSKKRRIIRTLK